MWQHTVLVLMDFVPLIVVDVRGDSDVVRDELGWLAQPGRVEKEENVVMSKPIQAPVTSTFGPCVDNRRTRPRTR